MAPPKVTAPPSANLKQPSSMTAATTGQGTQAAVSSAMSATGGASQPQGAATAPPSQASTS